MIELEQIAELARKQIEGGFTTESDALFALELVERLANAIKLLREEAGFA